VATVYVAQPVLDAISRSFAVPSASIGSVVAFTQMGYAAGLIFIVPLGDLVDRRKLIIGLLALSAVALATAAAAPTVIVFFLAVCCAGLCAVAAQLAVAYAADRTADAVRGRVVGLITSGIIIGITAARFISGAIADIGGWRAIYAVASCGMLVMAFALYRALPVDDEHHRRLSYVALLRSVPDLFRTVPLFASRAAIAFFTFASFSVLWTGLVFPLTGEPISLSHTQVGLFGLAGLAGALAARGAGRLADGGFGQRVTGFGLALLAVSWIPMAFPQQSLLLLAFGVVLLDFAVQALHVSNMSLLFTASTARSRLVAGYMIFYSLGSGVGAVLSTALYASFGWTAVCALGAALALCAFAVWLLSLEADVSRDCRQLVPQDGERR
jgi:predicted MFS family arabinose efflux permease